MSLSELIGGLMGKHGDTLQQAALLAYLKDGDEGKKYLEVHVINIIYMKFILYSTLLIFMASSIMKNWPEKEPRRENTETQKCKNVIYLWKLEKFKKIPSLKRGIWE